jgi:hypothetical protein
MLSNAHAKQPKIDWNQTGRSIQAGFLSKADKWIASNIPVVKSRGQRQK